MVTHVDDNGAATDALDDAVFTQDHLFHILCIGDIGKDDVAVTRQFPRTGIGRYTRIGERRQ